ncbi:MAG: NTPase, partial [Pseudanabaena sp. M110S1SP2A07QC]|nr:NTPase [Pseudanabaena sp. M110S1SP2A07QC]
MSIEIIKQQINKFVSHDTPEVIAIKGEWGVGKTYAWNTFLSDAQKENRVALKKYSYVSMFGINSLDAFKYAIFENVIDRELIGVGANVETFKQNTSSLLEKLTR